MSGGPAAVGEPAPAASDQDPRGTWRRIGTALRARPNRSQLVVGLLCGLLAFGLVTQVHATSTPAGITTARPDDLLGILTDLDNRAARLRATVGNLEQTEQRLRSGSGRDQAALREARSRTETLGILTGALAARGPGVVVTITDPRGQVRGDVLVDALQELRDSGAEAIELSGVRVVASTAIVDAVGGVRVDGTLVHPPYRLLAIGDPRTLRSSLAIPGGVLDAVDRQPGAHATVTTSPRVTVAALRRIRPPRYARPAR